MEKLQNVQLNLNIEALLLLNLILAIIMFGVALDLRFRDFKIIFHLPRAPLIGLVAQFLLLPAFTYLLVQLLEPEPGMALGMILVATCPGGNVSNVMTHLARGNTALSVSMTAISSAAAVLLTPLNFAFWGSLDPAHAALLQELDVNPLQIFFSVVLVLGVPLVVGMTVAARFPGFAARARNHIRYLSYFFFLGFIAVAFAMNADYFVEFIGLIFLGVFLHNAMGFILGYGSARLLRIQERDARAISLETGIQNAGLALALVLTYFADQGGMAIIAGWYGIWELIAGLLLAAIWARNGSAKGEGLSHRAAAKDGAGNSREE
ncbi:MAG: symporter [Leptospiraceae bacterium]|nr:symporter [Leptospiraceae bacterium]